MSASSLQQRIEIAKGKKERIAVARQKRREAENVFTTAPSAKIGLVDDGIGTGGLAEIRDLNGMSSPEPAALDPRTEAYFDAANPGDAEVDSSGLSPLSRAKALLARPPELATLGGPSIRPIRLQCLSYF